MEKWKEIKGYEGYYEISNHGHVRSMDRTIMNRNGVSYFWKSKQMLITKSNGRNGNGYLVVNLHKNGKSKVHTVHTLVARAFLPNPNNLPTVNHIDGDKSNNYFQNLEWTSYRDNNIHALDNKLRYPRGNAIVQLSLDGKIVNLFSSTVEACKKTGVSIGSISHCLNHRTKTAGGYQWIKLSECVTTIPVGSTSENELPMEAQEQQLLKI